MTSKMYNKRYALKYCITIVLFLGMYMYTNRVTYDCHSVIVSEFYTAGTSKVLPNPTPHVSWNFSKQFYYFTNVLKIVLKILYLISKLSPLTTKLCHRPNC
jgi:hypothetical protein